MPSPVKGLIITSLYTQNLSDITAYVISKIDATLWPSGTTQIEQQNGSKIHFLNMICWISVVYELNHGTQRVSENGTFSRPHESRRRFQSFTQNVHQSRTARPQDHAYWESIVLPVAITKFTVVH
jgi:hypothetical protein